MTARFATSALIVTIGCATLAWAGDAVYTVDKDGLIIQGKIAPNDAKASWLQPGAKSTDVMARRYQVKLDGGRQYRLSMDGKGFDAKKGFDSVIIVKDSAGHQLASDDDSGGGLNSLLIFDALKDGVYEVLAASLHGSVGSFTLKINEIGPIKVHEIRERLKLEGALNIEDEAGFKAETITLNVKLAADKTYVIDMRAKDKSPLDPYLQLLDSDGRLVAEDDDSGGQLDARIVHRPKAEGIFQIVATTLEVQVDKGKKQPGKEQPQPGRGQFTLEIRTAAKDEKLAITPGSLPMAKAANLIAKVAELYGKENFRDALPFAEQAVTLRRELRDEEQPSVGWCLYWQGTVEMRLGDLAAALPHLKEAVHLTRAAASQNPGMYVACLQNLGAVYFRRGDYAAAELLQREALQLLSKAKAVDSNAVGVAQNNLARIYYAMGDLARAEPLFRESLEASRMAKQMLSPTYGIALANLGSLYYQTGKLDRAEPLYQEALEVYKKSGKENTAEHANVLDSLAMLHYGQGKYQEAEKLLSQALRIREKQEDKPGALARTLNNLGLVYGALGNSDKAAEALSRALELRKQALGTDHPDYAQTVQNLGLLKFAWGKLDEADALLSESLDITRRNAELAAIVQAERQQLAMAEALRVAIDIHLSLAEAAQHSADAVYPQVLAWKGLPFARQRLDRLGRQHQELAGLLTALESTSSQLAALTLEAPPPDTQTWKTSIQELTQKKDTIERELSLQGPHYAAERARWRQTAEAFQKSLPDDVALIDFIQYNRYSPAADAMGKLEKQRRLAAFVVRADKPIVRVDLGPVEPIAAAALQWRQLDSKEAGEASPGGRLRKLVWEPVSKHAAGARIVLVAPEGVLTRIPFGALPGSRSGTYLLEETAIAVAPVPQFLPELLGGEAARKAGPATLLVVGAVDYASAKEAAPPAKAGPVAAPPVVSRTAPRGKDQLSLSPLDTTGREIDEVAKRFRAKFGGGDVTELRGSAATEAAFQAQAPRKQFLHLATYETSAPPEIRSALARAVDLPEFLHTDRLGVRDSLSGWHPGQLTGLALAGANEGARPKSDGLQLTDDGVVTALEVADMDMTGTDLVVLSAGEPGQGPPAGGEAVLGLQGAFQVAGARTVVASLWKVDDDASQRFMASFYDNLWQKQMTPLEALRTAQLSVLNSTTGKAGESGASGGAPSEAAGRASPRLWAAWVLSGDPTGPQAASESASPTTAASPTESRSFSWLPFAIPAIVIVGVVFLIVAFRRSKAA
jgi:CHAT domain-containing protein